MLLSLVVELDVSRLSFVPRLVCSGLFNSKQSVRVSFDYSGLIVFIRLLLVMLIVLNWACAGMVWSNAQTVERKSMLVFMPQRYDTNYI